ncbi:two-component sensor histidine kinase [Enterococcus florum]|uniref:histidine kinase n=1 Tax=Enterococcus florum TaxID=2480627 RepID=A0A4P5PFE3_9ENTE|nr:ATP-binding protein [Enterococcus florum]GCF92173.1 two-component sensor histidine kinase [Enterococcus florum]
MKKRKLDYLFLFVLMVALFIGSWNLANRFYQKELVNQQEEFLLNNGQLLISQFSLDTLDSEENDQLISHYAKELDERVTLLNQDGTILFDSSHPDLTGSRTDRPEIQAVLANNTYSSSVRYSQTLKKELLYTAQPIVRNNQRIGVLRIAKSTSNFAPKTADFQRSMFIILLLFYLFLYLGISYLIYQRNRPVETVLPVLKRMVKSPEKSNFVLQDSAKWQELYVTINHLSEQLHDTYAAFTTTEEQFKTLFHELMIGVFIIDEHGKFFMINPTMEEILQMGGASQHYYWQVIEDNKLIQLIQQVMVEKSQVHQEIAIRLPQRKNLDVHLRFLENAAGDQIMGTVYDLTHVRHLEKIQRDFVGNVSHELKTPVTSLIGFTETLLDGAKENPELTTEFLTIMHKDAVRLQHLIQDIIELSKDSDHVSDELQTIELHDFVLQQLEFYQHLLTKKDLTVNVVGAENVFYQTRPVFFQPILKNLLENAIQYSPEHKNIVITYKVKEVLEIKITDTGIGISKEDQERIFERFYRVDRARSRHSGGTGLGLAIVKEYTEILGGTVSVESHPKLGSTFTVTLPIN